MSKEKILHLDKNVRLVTPTINICGIVNNVSLKEAVNIFRQLQSLPLLKDLLKPLGHKLVITHLLDY